MCRRGLGLEFPIRRRHEMDKEYKLGKFVGLNLSIIGRVYPGIVSNGIYARKSAQRQAALGRL